MPRFYISFNKITGKVLPDFSPITSIGVRGLENAFYKCAGLTGSISFPSLTSIGERGLENAFNDCTGLTNISFPSLTSIGERGLYYAFYDCTGLTGSISFPSLTSIGDRGLYYTFKYCTGITEIHFKSSLSGNSECTASNMGCNNDAVYFDLP